MTSEIVKKNPDLVIQIEREIIQLKKDTAISLLKLGALLKVIRDEKLYKERDFDTFESYIAQPEIGFARSTAYMWIHFYELYVVQLHYEPHVVAEIPIGNLQVLSPYIAEHPDEHQELMALATTSSKSDLQDSVRELEGKEPKEREYARQNGRVGPEIRDFKSYTEFVRAHRCCVCGNKESDLHHFPKTRGAGGRDYKVIPLCRRCHTGFHQDPTEFWLTYREQIMDYFYDTIIKAFNILQLVSVSKV